MRASRVWTGRIHKSWYSFQTIHMINMIGANGMPIRASSITASMPVICVQSIGSPRKENKRNTLSDSQ